MAVPGAIRRLAAAPPAGLAVDLLERLVPARPDTLAVLTFHRVGPDSSAVPPGLLSATPAGFVELIERVARRRTIVSIDDVVRRADGGPAQPRRATLLTFDDAYADFAEHAWPALRERRLPAVLFVPTAYPDAPERSFWWDRLHRAIATTTRPSIAAPGGELPLASAADRAAAYRAVRDAVKAMPHVGLLETVERLAGELGGDAPAAALGGDAPAPAVLGWERLRTLAGEGVALAPHTRTHPLLPRLDPAALAGEIGGSREDLAGHAGSDTGGAGLAAFAYPSGAVSPAVAAAVAAAGLRVAFTTARGVNDLRSASWLLLRRINVSVRTPSAVVRAQLIR